MIYFQIYLCVINIIAIIVCTVDKIKAQLKQDFTNASNNDKKEMLLELGDNIIRASKDCNVGYLRDSVHFLTETDDSEAFRVLLQIYPVIPTELEKIKTTPVQTAIEGYVVDTPVEKQTIEKVEIQLNGYVVPEVVKMEHDWLPPTWK